ncbi:MAG: arsenate reductase (glutaredoxin) [Microthrixaceae bacterium]
MPEVEVWYNPRCSKCRTASGILADRGVDATVLEYLKEPPTVEELRSVMTMIGTGDPRAIARRGEAVWRELGLDDATDDEVLAAMAANPILIERPIVVVDGRAVVARPPERLLELLGD